MTCFAMLEGMANPIPTEAAFPAGSGIPAQDSSVDADHLAMDIYKTSAGVSRVDGSIGLDEVLKHFNLPAGTSQGAHAAARHGEVLAKGVPKCHDRVSNLELVGISKGRGGQAGSVDLDDGHIRLRICSHHFALKGPFVGERHRNFRWPWRSHGCSSQCTRQAKQSRRCRARARAARGEPAESCSRRTAGKTDRS